MPQQKAIPTATSPAADADRPALVSAEAEAERRLASFRLAFASAASALSLYFFASAQISLGTCGLHIGIFSAIFIYSTMIFSELPRPAAYRIIPYATILIDFSAIATIAVTLYRSSFPPEIIHSAFLLALMLPLLGAAMHTRATLSALGGAAAIGAYLLVQSANSTINYVWAISLSWPSPLIIVSFIATAAYLSALSTRANRALIRRAAAADRRLFSFGSTMPVMTFRLNSAGEFIWINPASSLDFDPTHEKMRGHSIREYLADFVDFRTAVFPLRGTFPLIRAAGGLTHADCIIQLEEGNTRTRTFIGTLVDASEREKAIAEREEMVERLFQNRQMESLGILASGMAHDFNNILQTITDISTRVKDKSPEEYTRREMALIAETLTDARFLVAELIALGRKKPLDYDTLDIASFLKSIVPYFAEQLGEGYSIDLRMSDERLQIQGDPAYLKRIFQNLFGNARDAMPGGGRILVECSPVSLDGGTPSAVIRISDSGIGIPPEIAERIFEPFYSTKKKGKGTGLGLALCRRIVSLHKGTIRLEEDTHKGACFRIEIPLSGDERVDLDTRTIMLNRMPATLLVLDDDPKIRAILREFLADLSYPTHDAGNAEQALEQLSEHRDEISVIIMDWRLGAESPVEVIRSLRSIKSDLVIIVLSGYPAEKEIMRKYGIARWITKPYEKNQLDFEIQKALYRAHPGEISARQV